MNGRPNKKQYPDPTAAMQAAGVTWNDCWRTPPEILALVRELGPIGLDPCTAPDNPTGAKAGYTVDEPAPAHGGDWSLEGTAPGDVTYCNWPYSINGVWARRVIEHAAVAVPQGRHVIGLANASVGSAWFGEITRAATATCLTDQRLKFLDPLPPHAPTQGNQWGTGIWYFGPEPDRFAAIFSRIGTITQLYRASHLAPYQEAIITAAARLNVDEHRVIERIVRRLVLGLDRYGPLDLNGDKRNWRKEKHEELLDMLVYGAIMELKTV